MNKQVLLNPRILYVEDDDDTKELVRFLLTQENYEVVLAESSEQALLIARDRSFNLYLVDNWLSGLSGVELCRRLREFDATTPVLFYSAAAYAHDIREAIAAGAQGYITKPAENQTLLEEISRLVSTPEKGAASCIAASHRTTNFHSVV
jgi:DNA-binding response OmpR family regulator